MNAAEKANSLEIATKIAAVANLVKAEFPDVKTDLKPWANDRHTQSLVDEDSIDLAFHLPGWSRKFQSRSILMQIRFHGEESTTCRAIGIEMAGFNHNGQQWRFSTIEYWQFVGQNQPSDEIKQKLKQICQQVLLLLNGCSIDSSS